MPTYSIDTILAHLNALDLEEAYIVSAKTKKQIKIRLAYAIEGSGKGKLKGLVVLVPDRDAKSPSPVR